MKIFLKVFRWLLFPFAVLYAGVTTVRNWLYTQGFLKSHAFSVPVICIGNLTVGGTGKTPHTEYLIRLLKDTHRVTTLSRGYGRSTKGFRWATADSASYEIGDEPMQFYQKFGREIRVAVGEDRVAAIQKIQEVTRDGFALRNSKPEVILLDDAFQHRAVTPSFSILVTDYNRLFYKDCLLPTGNLREARRGARRAHVVIVSKCPGELLPAEREQIRTRIQKYICAGVPVFFTGIRYESPVSFMPLADNGVPGKVLLVSGIAQPDNLEAYVRQMFDCSQHLNFNDHHAYTQADMEKIRASCQKTQTHTVLTTEKDYVKLSQMALPADIAFYYLPIEIYFLFNDQEKFNRLLMR